MTVQGEKEVVLLREPHDKGINSTHREYDAVDHNSHIGEMLQINVQQKRYYEAEKPHSETGSRATNMWARTRHMMGRMREKAAINDDLLRLHQEWLGDLSDKKVLDLGCFAGNTLSMYLARASASYLGLDLSEQAIARLNRKLHEAGLYGPETRAEAGDFLSPEFREAHFDVIYAWSVLHHFEHLEAMLTVLHDKLAPGGIVVTQDPLQTSLPVRAIRLLYRPLQLDRAWEFPFTRDTFSSFQEYFVIEEVQGAMGRSKWAFLMLPLGTERAARLARRLHQYDLEHANRLGEGLWRCMKVVMKLRRGHDSA